MWDTTLPGITCHHHHHQPINVLTAMVKGLPYGPPTRRTDHNPPRGPNADWWVLTTANTARTNGLTCIPKHGGARDITFLIIHPMTDQCCLVSAIVRRSALTWFPCNNACEVFICLFFLEQWRSTISFWGDSLHHAWRRQRRDPTVYGTRTRDGARRRTDWH
jgi:hypothetical protein